MKILEMAEATASLAEYARDVRAEPVMVTSRGKPVAALVSIPNVDRESLSLSNNPQFLAILERSWARLKKEGGISDKEMRRRLGIKRRS